MNDHTLEIPAALKRVTNDKGITLSAGVDQPVTVTAGKTEPKLSKKAAKAAAKEAARKAAEAALAAAPEVQPEPTPEPVVEHAAPQEAPSTPVTADLALNADGTPKVKVRRSIVPMKFKARYAKHGGTCGDDMATELKAATTTLNADKRESLDVDALWAIAAANGVDVERYLNLNNGQKRMNVGNKLRGLLKAGTNVTIGTRTFDAAEFEPGA